MNIINEKIEVLRQLDLTEVSMSQDYENPMNEKYPGTVVLIEINELHQLT